MIKECPRCSKTKFEKLTVSGVELDRCESCKGIWMDGGEYEKVVESSRNLSISGTDVLSPPDAIREESYQPLRVSCPGCGQSLLEPEPIHFEFIHHVVITDRCSDCDGVWFDASELSLMLEYIKKEDKALAKIAKKELNALEQERDIRERDKILEGKEPVDRRTFWRVLFGLPSEKE